MKKNNDHFEFFRQHLAESGTKTRSTDDERGNRSITEYPFIAYAPLVVGILVCTYTLGVGLGAYSVMEGGIISQIQTLEKYSGIVLALDTVALALGLAGVVLSNKKKYPIAGSILCFLPGLPLLYIYLSYITPYLHE